jgi:hypothetical protein
MEILTILFTALAIGLGIGLFFSIYLLPWIIAYNCNSHNKDLILIVNVLLGFTILGWGACLLWALVEKRKMRTNLRT